MSYFKSALRGIGWMTALSVLTKGTAVLKIAILARLLSPEQFGKYGIALLVLGFLEMLTETGINIFLIQQKEDTEKYLDSAWVVSIIRGLVIAFIIVLFTPLITAFFKTGGLTYLLTLIAVVAFFRGLINPMVVVFQKKLEFMKLFIFRGGLYAVDAAVAVSLAFITKNESSMIIGMMAAVLLEVLLSFALFKTRPKLKFEKEKFLKVVNSGKWVTGAGIFSYLFQNIDNIVVGRVLSTTNLGFYQQSYSIATIPVSGVSDIFNRVLFPFFVKISDDSLALKKSFFKALSIIFSLSFFYGLFLIIFSERIILIVLGENWLSIAPTLRILAVFGIFKSVLNSTYSLFLSLKMQKTVMFSEFIGILGIGAFIIPMVNSFGLKGAAYSALAAVLLSLPVVLINIGRLFKKHVENKI